MGGEVRRETGKGKGEMKVGGGGDERLKMPMQSESEKGFREPGELSGSGSKMISGRELAAEGSVRKKGKGKGMAGQGQVSICHIS